MRWLIALSLIAAPFAGSTEAQDAKAGEKATIVFESTLELETVVRDGKGETTRLLNLTRKEKFNQVRMDGKTVKIECVSSSLQKSGTDTPADEKPTALAGQSFFSTKTENGWTVQDVNGGAPPNEGANLGAWNDISVLLPASGEVKTGDKWTVDGKALMPLIFPTALREGTGKIECACESADGGKANVVFTGSVGGKGRDEGQTITLTVKSGRLTYDLEKKRPVNLMLSGSFEALTDMVDVVRKPGTGTTINNDEERRKVGEISVKSHKLEAVITFE